MTREELIEHIKYPLKIGADITLTEEDAEQMAVLDKIRAEIEACREDEEPHLCDYRYHRNEGLDMALDIIDKYRTEREE